jgi:hypothetical protein
MEQNRPLALAVGIMIVLCIAGTPVFAQAQSRPDEARGSFGYFAAGIGWLLESGNSSMVYSAGGGGHSITNRWILGGEGHSAFGADNAGGYGFLDLGYLVLSSRIILAYPLVSLGGGSMTRESSPSVSKCFLLTPSVEVDFLIPIRGRAGIFLGLRGGYASVLYSDTFTWSMPHGRLIIGGFGFGG